MNVFFETKKLNYTYFLFIFFILFLISSIRVFYQIDISIYEKSLFLFYFLIQTALETFFLFIFSAFFKKIKLHFLYLILVFILLGMHATDLVLLNLMDCNAISALKLLFAFSLDNFTSTIHACNMNSSILFTIWTGLFALPILSILSYRLTNKISQKTTLPFSSNNLGKAFPLLLLVFFFSDLFIYWKIIPENHLKLQKAALFHTTIFKPNLPQTTFPAKWFQLEEKKQELPLFTIKQGPNIFLFIVETFRKDFINEKITPHLFSFTKNNTSFDLSIANANTSFLSWFSIFHSQMPLHWKKFHDEKKFGAAPIQLLKKLGYTIHVYSSSDLSYFAMDTMLFGGEKNFVDHFHNFFNKDITADQRDLTTLNTLQTDLDHFKKHNNLFIVFLDSTHSEYSWPIDFPTNFSPIIEKIDYLPVQQKKEKIEKIKNRYRNSLCYVDSLFSKFFQFLQQNKYYDPSMIVITGDHGEEFFENGSLFHGSHLNFLQVHVPIIYKFPKSFQKTIPRKMSSHVDIFPTILDVISMPNSLKTSYGGTSIFSKTPLPFLMAFQQNGGFPPNTFFIHNGSLYLTAKILKYDRDFYTLEILEIKDENEKKLMNSFSKKDLTKFLDKNFPFFKN